MGATPRLTCYILDTGHCLAHEHHLMQGGEHRQIDCHSIVALLQHPEHGWLLWDAGYAPRMLDATVRFPYRLYRWFTPLRLRPELAAAAQLPRYGLTPNDIGAVIVSHFHADHESGLRDFPTSRYVALRDAYASVANLRGFAALRRGHLPSLLPADFAARLTLLAHFDGPPLPALGPTHDYFGDGSLLLVQLPGHARGQIGMLANTTRGQLFFVADSCWLARSVETRRPPARITNFLVDDTTQLQRTIDGLHDFAQARPDVLIVPSHCPETFRREAETVPSV